MKKLLFLIAAAMIAFLPSCSNEEPTPEPTSFRTRADLPWYGTYDQAWDSFWEMISENDNMSAQYLSRTTWLPKKIYDQFVDAILTGGASSDPELSWENTAFVVREVLEYADIDNKQVPIKICYSVWCVQEGKVNGTINYRYATPDSNYIYIVEIDPYE